MAIEILDSGACVASFHLTPGGLGVWELYGRGVTGVAVGPDNEAIVSLEEALASVDPVPDGVPFKVLATVQQGDPPGGYATVRILPNDALTAIQKIGIYTYRGVDVGGAPVFVELPVDVLVFRIPQPFVARVP